MAETDDCGHVSEFRALSDLPHVNTPRSGSLSLPPSTVGDTSMTESVLDSRAASETSTRFCKAAQFLQPAHTQFAILQESTPSLPAHASSSVIDGHVGYYCAGMNEHAIITIDGNAGTGVAENMMSGEVRVCGDAGQLLMMRTADGSLSKGMPAPVRDRNQGRRRCCRRVRWSHECIHGPVWSTRGLRRRRRLPR